MVKNNWVPEKSYTGKFFDFEIFNLKYVLKHSDWITSDQKKSTKNFWVGHFFSILFIFAEKRKSPRKKFCKEKIFDFKFLQFLVEKFFIKNGFPYYFELIFSILGNQSPLYLKWAPFYRLFGIFCFENDVFAKFSSQKNFFEKKFSSFFYINFCRFFWAITYHDRSSEFNFIEFLLFLLKHVIFD